MPNLENLKPPFQKGNQAAKGHGRPKGSVSLTKRLLALLEAQHTFTASGKSETKDGADWIASALFRQGLKGNMRAIKEIYERVDGKMAQAIEPGLNMSGVDLSTLSNEQVEYLLKKMLGDQGADE